MFASSELEMFGLVVLAGVLGGLVGAEREWSGKPAGLRTLIFVCAGSALLMLLGEAVVDSFERDNSRNQTSADPIRVIQSIVVGISFLGAGTIVHQSGNQVEGLTTAAAIYLTAGIGVAVAVGLIALAVATTLMGVVVLWGVGWMEHRFFPSGRASNKPPGGPPAAAGSSPADTKPADAEPEVRGI